MIALPVHDQDGCRNLRNLPTEDRDDIHHLMDGNERHAPIRIVRTARHILKPPPRLRHIAIHARLTRRQMLDPLLGCDHDGCTEAHNVSDVRLDGEEHGKSRAHRMPNHRDLLTHAAEDGRTVAHRVHPVLMLHAAQILDRRPVPREPNGKHGKAACVQIFSHEAQLCRQPRESVYEEHAMRPTGQQKRLRSLKMHDDFSLLSDMFST